MSYQDLYLCGTFGPAAAYYSGTHVVRIGLGGAMCGEFVPDFLAHESTGAAVIVDYDYWQELPIDSYKLIYSNDGYALLEASLSARVQNPPGEGG